MSDPLYPVALRLSDKPVLVVGGGPVAARKVRRLRASGARITLIAPEAVDELAQAAAAGALTWHRRAFETDDVLQQRLVFAATGVAAADEAVAVAARAAGCWLNAADSAVDGDFDLPALLRRGELCVTVSTGGAAPGFAATLAEELGEQLDESVGDYVGLLRTLRGELRQQYPEDPILRQRAFAAALACTEARRLAGDGRLEQARRAVDAAVSQVGDATDSRAPGDEADG